MSNPKSMLFGGAVLAVLFLGLCPDVQAQSPYGLAARQTIPFVIEQRDERGPVWTTEINIHNPGPATITVRLDLFVTWGHVVCNPQTVGAGGTAQFSLLSACPNLNPVCCAPDYGRLELNALPPAPAPSDPAAVVFLANARLSGPGRYFTVEGFPQGNLSGNKKFAAVTGLKSVPSQWQPFCFAESLNESPQVWVKLVDGSGSPVGGSAFVGPLVPTLNPIESFGDVFAAVGAPPGNYSNVTALFSTAPFGGTGGEGAFAFCRIVNLTQNQEAFEVAKYLDNNDEGRKHRTVVSDTAWGEKLFVIAEVAPSQLLRESNLHVAYFQHPDRVRCTVRVTSAPIPFFDLVQFRLVDPDLQVVATVVNPGGVITFDLGEKSQRHNGRNGRWLVEVAPRRTQIGCTGGGLCQGGLPVTGYELICSSGNGHNQLDVIGHCLMTCQKDPQQKKYALCDFDMPFLPQRCSTHSPVP